MSVKSKSKKGDKVNRKGRESGTSYSQRMAMLEWLEEPTNFALITGAAGAQQQSIIPGTKL